MVKNTSKFMQWPNLQQTEAIADKFLSIANFPRVIACIDGSHMRIARPAKFGDAFINRKNFYSLNVQVICDVDLCILDVNACWPESTHDSRVLRESGIFLKFQSGELPILPGTVILGDSGYPLLPWLMTPVTDRGELSAAENAYNLSHCRTRNCIERCFGVLKRRWSILNDLRVNPTKASHVTVACCSLHNICRKLPLPLENEDICNDLDDVGDAHCGSFAGRSEGEGARQQFITYFA